MKITKFVHSCLLVEMPEPVNRTALFDPGSMSADMLKQHDFQYLDDIFITHNHGDHLDVDTVKWLVEKFPDVRVIAPTDTIQQLRDAGVNQASDQLPEGVTALEAPHESVAPLFPGVEEYGFNYLDLLTHPGDSHSFGSTCKILALPVYGPWGSTVKAANLGLELKPEYIVPIHDFPLRPEVLKTTYDNLEKLYTDHDITFIKAVDGEPFVIAA